MVKRLIFIADKNGNDIGIFASIEDAQLQLEPIDVANDEYIGYDSEGRLMRTYVEGSKVTISPAEDKPIHVKELKTALIKYLGAKGELLLGAEEYSLASLVEICNKYLFVPKGPKDIIQETFLKLISKLGWK